MEIRRATRNDLEQLIALNSQVQHLHIELFPDIFKEPGSDSIAGWFLQQLNDPAADIILAREDHRVIGYLLMKKIIRSEHAFKREQRVVYIDQVCVDRDYRGRGVFRKLLDTVKTTATAWGAEALELDVWTDNAEALSVFEKSGFKTAMQRMTYSLEADNA